MCCNLKIIKIAGSTNFKKVYELYQREAVKKGISIIQFCKMNGIVYSHFERWYKQDCVGTMISKDKYPNPYNGTYFPLIMKYYLKLHKT